MAEAAKHMLKYYELYLINIPSFGQLQTALDKIIHDYNHRPNHSLNGLTPMEVFALLR
jgi:transposase InsO family protein